MKNTLIILAVVILLGVGGYFIWANYAVPNEAVTDTNQPGNEQTGGTDTEPVNKEQTVIGKSAEGRDITAYHYGEGNTELLFVGGIHGGYEWNTVLVAYELMDYLKANPTAIPANVKVTVIPALNPDGLNKTVGTAGRFTQADVPTAQNATVAGRFNANNVDLNRNFDCDWQTSAKWQDKIVSGGSSAFSEPESLAMKNYVETSKPKAVVVWYSAAGGVFASNCHNGVSSETQTLTNTYATASGYPAFQNFDFYEITGDMVNWLAKNNIPAISVLLTNHTDTEWSKNEKGIKALLEYYTE
ncbi:MAG: M14 family metallopeptidase [Patescibacteria group bacterium]|nr:M14 family metallopeptidase [bacterium]MDZ4241162.1 M14 family metallopeptidase [Patescibacteria group bacterium]